MYVDKIYDNHTDAFGIIQLQEQGYVTVSNLVTLLPLVVCTCVV